MMSIKLMIFDLDGTILDTLEDLYLSTNYALRENSFPERTIDEIRQFVGNGIPRLIERAVPPETSEQQRMQVYHLFMDYYPAHCADNTKPYPGIPELLKQLRERHIRTAVNTNKADNAAQILCKDYFPGLFDIVMGSREGLPKKPAPDAVSIIMHKLEIPQEQTLYIGDSDVDIATARNAGIPCINAEWGFRDREFLIRHGAEHLAANPESILDIITQISAG